MKQDAFETLSLTLVYTYPNPKRHLFLTWADIYKKSLCPVVSSNLILPLIWPKNVSFYRFVNLQLGRQWPCPSKRWSIFTLFAVVSCTTSMMYVILEVSRHNVCSSLLLHCINITYTPILGFRLYSEYQDMVRICLEHGGITGYRDNEKKKDSSFQLSRGTNLT